jgi:hypothetical protein
MICNRNSIEKKKKKYPGDAKNKQISHNFDNSLEKSKHSKNKALH